MISLIFLVFAFVFACIAAVNYPPATAPASPNYSRLLAVALAFYFAACIFGNQVIESHLGHF